MDRTATRYPSLGPWMKVVLAVALVAFRMLYYGLPWALAAHDPKPRPSFKYMAESVVIESLGIFLLFVPLMWVYWNLFFSRAFGAPRITYWHAAAILLFAMIPLLLV